MAKAWARAARASASSITCSTCSRATRGWTSTSPPPATCTPARTTPSRTSGIVFGQALDTALGDRAGIFRYGHAVVPMDEARALCAIDISGRPFCVVDAPGLHAGETGGFEHELLEEFFRAVANNARMTLHIDVQAGTNAHHIIEVAFKAFARALRGAIAIDPTESGVPSTKGTLTA